MTKVTIALCAVLCAATGICEINVSTVEELKTALESAKSGRGWTDPETIVLKPGVYDLSRLSPAEVDAKASWNTAVTGSAAGLTYLQTAVPFCILKGGGRTPEETVLDGKLAADVRALTCRRERFGVANLTFRNFTTTGRGGALWGVRRISNCRFENCRAAEGGAVFYPGNPYGEYAEARDSVFVHNCSAGAGGAMFGLWTASNCVFSANVARGGQGGAGAGSPAAWMPRKQLVGCRLDGNAGADPDYHTLSKEIHADEDCVIVNGNTKCYGKLDGAPYVNSVTLKPGDDVNAALAFLRANRDPKGRAELVFEDGVHPVTNVIRVTAADQQLTFRARHPGRVAFRGSWDFSGAEMKRISADEARRFPADVRGRILGITVPEEVARTFSRCDMWDEYATRTWIWNLDPGKKPIPCRTFAVGDELMTLARWPNRRESYSHREKVYDKATAPEHFARWDFKDGEVVLTGFHTSAYDAQGPRISAYDAASNVLVVAQKGFKIGTGWFENVPEELDQPGEWAFVAASRRLYLLPKKGFGAKSDCGLPYFRDVFLDLTGAENVTFEGLVFERKVDDPAVYAKGCTGVKFAGCVFRAMESGRAVLMTGTELEFRSCDFVQLGGGALQLHGGSAKGLVHSNNLVENCHFAHNGLIRVAGNSTGMSGCGGTFRNNLVEEMPFIGMGYHGPEHLVEYNRIRRVSLLTGDSAGLGTSGAGEGFGSVVRYNDIGSARGYTMSLYLDDLSYGNRVYGNVIRYGEFFGVFLGGGRYNVISNNVITSCGGMFIDARGTFWPDFIKPFKAGTFAKRWENVGYKTPPWSTRYPELTHLMEDGNSTVAPLDNVFTMNVVCEVPTNRSPFALNGLLHKLVPSNRVHVVNNLYVRKTGKGKNSGWPREGVRTLDGTEDNPIDLGFVDLPEFKWSDERYSYYDEKGDFNLKPGARLLKELPGFAPIPWDKIGLYKDKWRTAL